jgi:hypothetical protein
LLGLETDVTFMDGWAPAPAGQVLLVRPYEAARADELEAM